MSPLTHPHAQHRQSFTCPKNCQDSSRLWHSHFRDFSKGKPLRAVCSHSNAHLLLSFYSRGSSKEANISTVHFLAKLLSCIFQQHFSCMACHSWIIYRALVPSCPSSAFSMKACSASGTEKGQLGFLKFILINSSTLHFFSSGSLCLLSAGCVSGPCAFLNSSYAILHMQRRTPGNSAPPPSSPPQLRSPPESAAEGWETTPVETQTQNTMPPHTPAPHSWGGEWKW